MRFDFGYMLLLFNVSLTNDHVVWNCALKLNANADSGE